MEGTNSKFARAIPIIAERFSIVNISLNITAYVIKHYFRTLKWQKKEATRFLFP